MDFKRKTIRGVMAAAFSVMACSAAAAQEVKVGAWAAAIENVFSKIKEPMEAATGLKIVLISNGPVDAVKELYKGSVQAAAGGLTVPDWMAMMEKEGYAIPDKGAYKFRVMGSGQWRLSTSTSITAESTEDAEKA